MITRLVSLITLLWTLSLSALGVAFGAEKDKPGFLGVVPGEVTSEIAAEYGVRPGEGVIVEGISSNSPAEKVGLRENDIIILVNNSGVTGPEEFRSKIAKMNPGDKFELTYVRGGKQKSATVELTSREGREFGFMSPKGPRSPRAPRPPRAMRERGEERELRMEKVAFAGVIPQNLSEGLAQYFKVKEGALIAEIVEDSPADKAGLKAGDVIIRIGDDDIEDEGDVREAIRDRKPADRVDFVIVRDGQQQTIAVTLGEQEMPDLGENFMEFDLPDLHALEGMHFEGMSEEQMRELHNQLIDLKIEIEGLDPMDIHIEQLPDYPRFHIEKHIIGPVRYDGHGWQRSFELVKNRFKAEFNKLSKDFARLREQLVDLGNELMGRTA